MIHIASDTGIRAAHETAASSVMSAGVIAVAAAWLASDESAHVSGATLRIDDGAGAAMVLDTRT
jgi:hypothetical protein